MTQDYFPLIQETGRFAALIHNFLTRDNYASLGRVVSKSTHASDIQVQGDLSTSDYFLNAGIPRLFVGYRQRQGFELSFSEEDDPKNEEGIPLRCYVQDDQLLYQVDPGDGTKDAETNLKELGYPKGGSILVSIMKGITPVAGMIFIYPERKMLLGTRGERPRLFAVDGEELYEVGFRRPRNDFRERIRINYRPRYPDKDLLQFFSFLHDQKKLPVEKADLGGAGDALGNLILGNVDYVVTAVGNWKTWDTDEAVAMGDRIEHQDGTSLQLVGTDMYGGPLVATIGHRIPWHQQGNIFTIEGNLLEMSEYVREFERESGIALRKDNK